MFSYYGSKNRLSKHYPKPMFDKIIEPFCGAANYSLRYWDRDVLLCDKSKDIISIWEFLKEASVADIQSLPKVSKGTRIDKLQFDTNGQYCLMQYMISQAAHYGTNLV